MDPLSNGQVASISKSAVDPLSNGQVASISKSAVDPLSNGQVASISKRLGRFLLNLILPFQRFAMLFGSHGRFIRESK